MFLALDLVVALDLGFWNEPYSLVEVVQLMDSCKVLFVGLVADLVVVWSDPVTILVTTPVTKAEELSEETLPIQESPINYLVHLRIFREVLTVHHRF